MYLSNTDTHSAITHFIRSPRNLSNAIATVGGHCFNNGISIANLVITYSVLRRLPRSLSKIVLFIPGLVFGTSNVALSRCRHSSLLTDLAYHNTRIRIMSAVPRRLLSALRRVLNVTPTSSAGSTSPARWEETSRACHHHHQAPRHKRIRTHWPPNPSLKHRHPQIPQHCSQPLMSRNQLRQPQIRRHQRKQCQTTRRQQHLYRIRPQPNPHHHQKDHHRPIYNQQPRQHRQKKQINHPRTRTLQRTNLSANRRTQRPQSQGQRRLKILFTQRQQTRTTLNPT